MNYVAVILLALCTASSLAVSVKFKTSKGPNADSDEDMMVEIQHVSGSVFVVGNISLPKRDTKYTEVYPTYPYDSDSISRISIVPYTNWPGVNNKRTTGSDGAELKYVNVLVNGVWVKYKGGTQRIDCSQSGNLKIAVYYPPVLPTLPPTLVPTSVPPTPFPAIPTSIPPTPLPTAAQTVVPAVPTSIPPTPVPTAAQTTTPTTVVQTMIPTGPVVQTLIPTTQQPSTVVPLVPSTLSPPVGFTSLPGSVVPIPSTSPPIPPPPSSPSPSPSTSGPAFDTNIPEPVHVHQMTTVPTPTPPFKTAVPTTVANAAATGAMLGSSGVVVGQAMRLVLISGGCQLGGGTDRELVKAFHITGLSINGSPALGLIIVNFIIIVSVSLIMKVASHYLSKLFPRSKGKFNANDPDGFLRFPSAPLVIFHWMYQGTTLSGFILLFYSNTFIEVCVGFASTAVCAAVPMCLAVVLREASKEGVYMKDPVPRNGIVSVFLGTGEWLSNNRDNHWAQKYASVIRSHDTHSLWCSSLQLFTSFFFSLMSSLETESELQCGHVRMGQATLFLAMLALEVIKRPHCKTRDFVMIFASYGCQATALIMIGLHFYDTLNFNWFHTVGDVLLEVVTGLLFLQVAFDIVCELYIFLSQRREQMQNQHWAGRDFVSQASDSSEPSPPSPSSTSQLYSTLRASSRSSLML